MEDDTTTDPDDEYSLQLLEKTKELNEDLTKQLNERIDKFGQELQQTFESRVATFNNQNREHVVDKVDSVQMDILKTNKIFRDISRLLSSNWKNIFCDLLPNTPQEIIDLKIAKLSQEKPLMQAYKSLLTWKELSGNNFNIQDVVTVLDKHNLPELSKTAESIINCDNKDSLFNLSSQFSNISKTPSVSTATKSSSTNQNPSIVSTATKSLTNQSASIVTGPVEGQKDTGSNRPSFNCHDALDDRHILLLSKKLAADWPRLAASLAIAQEDISEIMGSEGATYQGAFRMLHGWREAPYPTMDQKLETLVDGLKTLGRQDLEVVLRS